MRANERTDERVAQYFSLYSWLLSTIVPLPFEPPLPPWPEELLFMTILPLRSGVVPRCVIFVGIVGLYGTGRLVAIFVVVFVVVKGFLVTFFAVEVMVGFSVLSPRS